MFSNMSTEQLLSFLRNQLPNMQLHGEAKAFIEAFANRLIAEAEASSSW